MTQDLTHAEATAAFKAFRNEVGPNADIYVSLNAEKYGRKEAIHISLYPNGMSRGETLHADADTYVDLLAAIKAEWAKKADAAGAKTIREMALRIISITADEGVCSELSLTRAFSAAEVKTYGERACEEATRIAGNGPFSILCASDQVEAA